MILGIDSAIATCGWAVVRPRPLQVVEFGVITTDADPSKIVRSTDSARRLATVARELGLIRDKHRPMLIAGEEALPHGNIHAVIPQVLCWGTLVRLAVESDIDLAQVTAMEWQHDVQGTTVGAVDYKRVAFTIAQFIGADLKRIDKKLQTHAIDAVGIALYAALRPVTLIVHGKARREFHMKQQQETAS